jgi:GNAT superfamily N-acetyltransferase
MLDRTSRRSALRTTAPLGSAAPLRTTAPLRVRQLHRTTSARQTVLVAELLENGPPAGRRKGRHTGHTGTQVGVARYTLDADGVADISIEVVDAWRGVGIGSRLLDLLLTHAERAGVHRWRTVAEPGDRGVPAQRTSASASSASRTSSAADDVAATCAARAS